MDQRLATVAAEAKIKPAKLPNGMSHGDEGQKAEYKLEARTSNGPIRPIVIR